MNQLDTEQIRNMIGLHVKYHEVNCQVVEIIEDGLAIVLKDLEQHTSIQGDQHGEAHRKVPKTYTISVLNEDQAEFNPAFLALEPVEA
ncbi:MAG TPA: hypothetical protein ENK06_07710 [Gammaproteobacteria bacterium]|nr:hypothetical protein [Gammaproteobacteria bacterium]